LLTSSDGRRALIDGGRTETFQKHTWPVLRGLAEADEEIDLVVVSHIDADHISGILWLMKAVAAWAVHDYQTTDGGNPGLRPPTIPRPPKIKRFWHNSWRAQMDDMAGPIEALTSRIDESIQTSSFQAATAPAPAAELVDALQGLAESIPQGLDLMRLVDNDTPLERNEPFPGLVRLTREPTVQKLGKARLTVIGPANKHLQRLRDDWKAWLETDAGRAAARQEIDEALGAATIIASTDPTKATPPNRASITLLAEEDGRTCLLTGDAGEPELLRGLKAAGKLNGGPFRCNVLKVQHHGATANLSIKFAKAVLADHYVFCADGNHHNPEPSVIKTIVEGRRAVDPGTPYTLWFNCTPARTGKDRQAAMKDAIDEAKGAARQHPEITVEVLAKSKPFFELTV
jgi:beta-lactamase superfamily II metal-dependent hydrolase